MPTVLGTAVRGAGVGAAATGAMSVVMLAVQAATSLRALAPSLIVQRALQPLGVRSGPVQAVATVVAHFGYGAANGAVFGVVTRRGRGAGPVRGVAYAATLLVASYQGWVPAAGILPPLTRQTAGRRLELIGGHAVYGMVLGLLSRRSEQDEPAGAPPR